VLTVAIANASGKTAMVAVTGLKAKTEKVTVANQAFAYTVTAGAKTVTVTIDGKAYTSKVTVK
jgi:DNA-binding protein YbaB